MNKKILAALGLVIILSVIAFYRVQQYSSAQSETILQPAVSSEIPMTPISEPVETVDSVPTERYAGQVDRVAVEFEQTDYVSYRLITNGVIRSGELNTERGYNDDIDATVYVLNWQDPATEQRYVRLTAEPTRLYLLDSEQNIVRSSVLTLQE